ncbi:hypothetical protein ACFQU7_41280 [Pseudoroseomonas wenyumeiae]
MAQKINDKAGRFLLDPLQATGRAISHPRAFSAMILSAGPGPRVDSQVLLSDWLEAIARKDLTAWLWRIDHAVIPMSW